MACGPSGQSATVTKAIDPVLISALVRAEAWKARLLSGSETNINAFAREEGVTRPYVSRLMRVAFLVPDLKRRILDGIQPESLTLQAIMQNGLPLEWAEQRKTYAA